MGAVHHIICRSRRSCMVWAKVGWQMWWEEWKAQGAVRLIATQSLWIYIRNYIELAGAPASGGLTCYGASYARQ